MADDNTSAPNPSASDSDADRAARRPGPTIELAQGEFSSTAPADAAEAAAPEPNNHVEENRSARAPGRLMQWLYPPLAGAMAAGLVAGGFYVAGQRQAQRVAVPPAPASAPDLVARMTQLESIVAAIPKSSHSEADPVLPARVSALEQSAQSAREAVAALRRQIETLSSALAESKAGGKDAAKDDAASSSTSAPVPAPAIPPQFSADLADMQTRLRAAEDKLAQNITALAELAARPVIAPAPVLANPDPVLRLGVVAAMLDAQVRAGEPFAASFALAKKLAADQGRGVNLSALDAFAEKGVPSAPVLRASLFASIPTPKPPEAKPAPPQNAGQSMFDEVWTKLSAHAAQVVRVRKVEKTASEAVAPDYAPLAAALMRNDLAGARASLLALPEAQRAFAQNWLADMDARDKALAAASAFAANALAALSASAAVTPTAAPSTPSSTPSAAR